MIPKASPRIGRGAFGAALFAAALASLPPDARGEEVEHPGFRSWAGHPIGTTVAVRSTSVNPKTTLTTTTTTTLVAIKADRALLESKRVSDATGTVVEGLPNREEQLRWFPLLPGVRREEIGRPRKAADQGEETLRLAGREIRTTWYDVKEKDDRGATTTRTWLSEEVPGRLVKAVTRIPDASTVVTLELVEFKEGQAASSPGPDPNPNPGSPTARP